MLESPAWRALGINARRALDRIECEHMNHALQENGNLAVTHIDFLSFGIHASEIAPALAELERFGFIEVVQVGGRYGSSGPYPSRFRLTWIPDKYGKPASNEWKAVTQENVDGWKARRAAYNKSKKLRKKKRKK